MQNNAQLDLFKVYNPTLEHVRDMFYTSNHALDMLEELEEMFPFFDEEKYFQTCIDFYKEDFFNPHPYEYYNTKGVDFHTYLVEMNDYDVLNVLP